MDMWDGQDEGSAAAVRAMHDRDSIVITPPKVLTKDTLFPSSCWTLDELKKSGG